MTRYTLPHTLAEQIADGVVLVLGVCFAVAAVTALFVWATLEGAPGAMWPLVPYALGLIGSFGFSAAYNLTLHAPTRAVLRRFDHAAIYLLIASVSEWFFARLQKRYNVGFGGGDEWNN